MIKSELQNNTQQGTNVCDLKYLTELMDGKKHLIKGMMNAFLKQVPEELLRINNALAKKDYITIKNFSHTMKSSVSIMGISVLAPILDEMESLAAGASAPGSNRDEKIKELNQKLNLICRLAIEETEREKHNYV